MADATEKYYANERGKTEQYIGFEQKGKLITFNPKSHVRMFPSFQPEADGVTFHLSVHRYVKERIFKRTQYASHSNVENLRSGGSGE